MDITTSNKIKAWLANNKVCFVTNSITMPSCLFVSSMKTYLNYIPIQNFWIIPGIKNNEPFYGLNAFLQMYQYMLSNTYFDYVIYIDEDCFITDFELLIEEFKNFKESDCCLAGPLDGGVFCHRNHSKFMINTFLSFWNIKMLRDKKISFADIFNYINENLKNNKDNLYKLFVEELKKNSSLYDFFDQTSNLRISEAAAFRIKYVDLPYNETPYCKIVRDDPNNKIEPHQIPYSFDDEKTTGNFEPYYILEQALVLLTQTPIYYMFGSDFYVPEYVANNENIDMSGLTSAIYYSLNKDKDLKKPIAVHTWFSRMYTKWPTTDIQLKHTKRINTIIREFSLI